MTEESFFPYMFNKSDRLTGMDGRHGSIFIEILMDEFEGGYNNEDWIKMWRSI